MSETHLERHARKGTNSTEQGTTYLELLGHEIHDGSWVSVRQLMDEMIGEVGKRIDSSSMARVSG